MRDLRLGPRFRRRLGVVTELSVRTEFDAVVAVASSEGYRFEGFEFAPVQWTEFRGHRPRVRTQTSEYAKLGARAF